MSIRAVSAYALVQATVRARYSTLLGSGTWSALIECQDFESVLAILSKTVYGPYLQIASEMWTPRRTVYQLRWHVSDSYRRLIDLTPESGRQLLTRLWQSHEVDNMKATLRGVENGASWDRVRHLLSPVAEHFSLNTAGMERMVQSGGVAQAIERTRHTPYYDTLVHALDRYITEKNLFPLDVALDLDYRRGLWQSIQQLRGRDRDEALRLVGTMLDTDSLLWAIRYRVFHHLSEQEIINYTLPFGYRVRDEHIRAIAAGASIAQVVRDVYPDLENPAQYADESGIGLAMLEHSLHERLVGMCRATFRGTPFHIGIPLAYLILCESEIKNLTALIEAKASHLAREVFEPILVTQGP